MICICTYYLIGEKLKSYIEDIKDRKTKIENPARGKGGLERRNMPLTKEATTHNNHLFLFPQLTCSLISLN